MQNKSENRSLWLKNNQIEKKKTKVYFVTVTICGCSLWLWSQRQNKKSFLLSVFWFAQRNLSESSIIFLILWLQEKSF